MDIVTYALCKKQISLALAGAGALKGEKGDNGLSAYEIAKKNGYSGTEEEWVSSLVGPKGETGEDGYTPEIGENGNWFINGVDTGIPGRAVRSYNELEDLPTIPSKTSELTNDSNFVDQDALDTKQDKLISGTNIKTINNNSLLGPGNITIDTNKVNDVKVNGTSVVIDKIANIDLSGKQDSLTDTDKQNIADLHQDKVIDVKLNNVSVVEDRVANITIPDGTMGRDFTTNVTVGSLISGTVISATDKIADILYKILYREVSSESTVNLIFGGSNAVPVDIDSLDHKESVEGLEPTDLITNTYTHKIITGNTTTEESQYPVIAISKSTKLVHLKQWSAQGLEGTPLIFNTIETTDYNIYYLSTMTYDEDLGGTNYVFTFEEAS